MRIINFALDSVYRVLVIGLRLIAIPFAILGMFYVVSAGIDYDWVEDGVSTITHINMAIELIMWSVVSVLPFILSRTARTVKKNKKKAAED